MSSQPPIQLHGKLHRQYLSHWIPVIFVTKTLTTLDLGGNQIGARGIVDLSSALGDNKTLITLDLSSNHIGDEGAEHLANALSNNKVLFAHYFSFSNFP